MNAIHPGILEAFNFAEPEKVKRRQLAEMQSVVPRHLHATYDAARRSPDFDNYWANADAYDADSANSKEVRHVLVKNSRYEVENNGYAAGIARTYATDMIGVGPSLRMQTGSTGFNRLVELAWWEWSREVRLRQKLFTMAHAKHVDGETFGVLKTNQRVRGPVKLDFSIHETEQCASPYLSVLAKDHIDGIKFDEFGNPLYYEFLKSHPGAKNYWDGFSEVMRVNAKFVLHWFKVRRPGQHRGIPELTSTLTVGAASRRFREATVAAAETAADIAALLKTQLPPDDMDQAAPFSSIAFQKRMIVALPSGYEAQQMKAEHPSSTYQEFIKQQISEMARPISMPLCKAACDSSSYNYASGRLDYQTYYSALDIDREDVNDMVLDRLFAVWFEESVMRFGWLGGDPSALSQAASYHVWDWPKHPAADIESEAKANDIRLKNGSLSPSEVDSEYGKDSEDRLIEMANDYGVPVDEMRALRRNAVFNSANQLASMESAKAQQTIADAQARTAAAATQGVTDGE